MRFLIVEDDFISRRLLQQFLSPYGDGDIAVDGMEALKAFEMAMDQGSPYDLVCLDIMMPRMDGQEVLRRIRVLENEREVTSDKRVVAVMTTALYDESNTNAAFVGECVAYFVKPLDRQTFLAELKKLGVISW